MLWLIEYWVQIEYWALAHTNISSICTTCESDTKQRRTSSTLGNRIRSQNILSNGRNYKITFKHRRKSANFIFRNNQYASGINEEQGTSCSALHDLALYWSKHKRLKWTSRWHAFSKPQVRKYTMDYLLSGAERSYEYFPETSEK